jgi:hypothetical protein
LDHEIGGDIVIRIAIPVSANDPDFLTTQSLPKNLKDTKFVADAVDARLALVIGFHYHITPEVTYRSCTSWLRVIRLIQESGKMAPHYTMMRGALP